MDNLPEPEREFKDENNKEYKVKAIVNSVVYDQQANDEISSLYYLTLCKSYPEEKNTWEYSLAVIHLWKLINIFYKKHPKKLIASSLPLYFAPPIARPIVLKEQQLKQKYGRPSKKSNKKSKS